MKRGFDYQQALRIVRPEKATLFSDADDKLVWPLEGQRQAEDEAPGDGDVPNRIDEHEPGR